ncbi:DUF4190 domain-containing protein [Promicromonospora kroppenstedtii]|uniref:DUF4190 domain-containing protein n=1 Tax=Promicromonospora kroppenstedtii TaxID=440482 RepID=UPI0004AEF0CA|nr:DUF4190 domain-containing protein [Promicromonospora kroppenstedtii]
MTQPDEWKSPYDPPAQPADRGARPGPAPDQPVPEEPAPPSPYGQPYPQQPAPPAYGAQPHQQPYGPGQPHPGQPYPGQPYQYGTAYGYVAPPEKNALGIWSLVLGILSVLMLFSCGVGFLAGIPAVITGHLSRKAQKEGLADNGGMGLAGLITGWVTIGLTLLAVVGLVILFSIPEFREGFFDETTSTYSYEY